MMIVSLHGAGSGRALLATSAAATANAAVAKITTITIWMTFTR